MLVVLPWSRLSWKLVLWPLGGSTRYCFYPGTEFIQVYSKRFKTDYPWQKFLRQSAVNRVKRTGKMVLNDAHKKGKLEVAHEKKRAVGSSPSSERNLYHQRKGTPLLKWTVNICWASFVYQELCWPLHIQHCTELLQAAYKTKDAILIFLFWGATP